MPIKSKLNVKEAPYLDGGGDKVFSDPNKPKLVDGKEPLNYEMFQAKNRPRSMSGKGPVERSNGEIVFLIFVGCSVAAIIFTFLTNFFIGAGAATSLFVILLLVFIAVKD